MNRILRVAGVALLVTAFALPAMGADRKRDRKRDGSCNGTEQVQQRQGDCDQEGYGPAGGQQKQERKRNKQGDGTCKG